MNLEVDVERLMLAQKTVRAELMAERSSDGRWAGQLGGSPFATAAAVSALVAAHRRDSEDALRESVAGDDRAIEQVVQGDLSELLVESVHWLARHQNPDGGWGDYVGGRSNIAATMLVQAAFRLTGIPAKFSDLMVRADDYVVAQGGVAGLRKECGRDKSLLGAIMANCALAGMVSWRQVPTLQFELACLPRRWQRDLQVVGARQSTPIVLAIGRAKFDHDPPKNPISRLIRRSMRAKSLSILARLQSADESFLASRPLTAFVVMSLSGIGCQDHAVVERGMEFLLSSVRADSSWSIEPNLAISNTALALNSLAPQPADDSSREWISHHAEHHADHDEAANFSESCNWLLNYQQSKPNLVSEVPEGGWASIDCAGALPTTISTAQVLLALSRSHCDRANLPRERVDHVVGRGIGWLLNLQNDDGSWPTYYRDETLPRFEQSGPDVSAQVLRCLTAWQREWKNLSRADASRRPFGIDERIVRAIDRGWKYLESQQRDDGSFIPLWFGNEYQPDMSNPVVGTSQVLVACAEMERLDSSLAQHAAAWLVASQHSNGGWGPPRTPVDHSGTEKVGFRGKRANAAMAQYCSVEESSLAVSALVAMTATSPAFSQAASRGLRWLIDAVEHDRHRQPAIIGFSMSKLWYHERLYPLAFAEEALSRAVRSVAVPTPAASHFG